MKMPVIFAGHGAPMNTVIGWLAQSLDWAYEFDDYIYENIISNSREKIIKFYELGDVAKLAVPTPDHFYPLLYILGASEIKSVFLTNLANPAH